MRNLVSSLFGAALALALVITCGGGQAPLSRADGATPGSSCTPYAQSCDGNRLVACTRSGQDASLVQDCGTLYAASADNPGKCWDACPGGTGPCCALTAPSFTYDVSAPFVLAGSSYLPGYDANRMYETLTPGCAGGKLTLTAVRSVTTCPSSSQYVTLSLDRSVVSPGQTVTLPAASVTLGYSGDAGTCSAWTGAVSFDSDVPHWSVTINATCSETGKSIKVTGGFSGTQ